MIIPGAVAGQKICESHKSFDRSCNWNTEVNWANLMNDKDEDLRLQMHVLH